MKVTEETINKGVLSKCKLCGGEAKIAKIERNDGQCRYDNWSITCTRCGCHFEYAADNYYGRDYISKEEAINKWNALHKTDRKIYIVTAGEYSDYHIDAVFTNETIANQYANLDSDRNVEEYETDIESIEADPNQLVYHVSYDFETGKIATLCLTSGHSKGEDFVFDYQTIFVFYVSPSETLNKDIRRFGMHSDWLLKIAQDRFYMYCDAHETSRQELLRAREERYDRLSHQYPMYSTSLRTDGDGLFNPYWHADRRMPELMKKYVEEHGTFPDADTLRKLYDEQVQEVKDEHGQ